MKKVGLYIIIAAAVLALIVWKLNSNKKRKCREGKHCKAKFIGRCTGTDANCSTYRFRASVYCQWKL